MDFPTSFQIDGFVGGDSGKLDEHISTQIAKHHEIRKYLKLEASPHQGRQKPFRILLFATALLQCFEKEGVEVEEQLVFGYLHLVLEEVAAGEGEGPLEGGVPEDEVVDGGVDGLGEGLLCEVGDGPVTFDGVGAGEGGEGKEEEGMVG